MFLAIAVAVALPLLLTALGKPQERLGLIEAPH